jgi:hypothetical protein
MHGIVYRTHFPWDVFGFFDDRHDSYTDDTLINGHGARFSESRPRAKMMPFELSVVNKMKLVGENLKWINGLAVI